MIATGGSDQAAGFLFITHAGEQVQSAADLERTDVVRVLQLDERFAAKPVAEQRMAHRRSGQQVLHHHAVGPAHLIEAYGEYVVYVRSRQILAEICGYGIGG